MAPHAPSLVDELRRYEAAGGRVVLISRSDLPFEQVAFDNHEGARKLAGRLAGLGYRRCLIVGSGTPLLAMRQRVEGFIAGLAEAGVRQRDRPQGRTAAAHDHHSPHHQGKHATATP